MKMRMKHCLYNSPQFFASITCVRCRQEQQRKHNTEELHADGSDFKAASENDYK